MKKGKQPKTNAIRILDKAKIAYKLHEYPWSPNYSDSQTSLEELDPTRQKLFKTIVTIGDRTGVVVTCIPGKSEIDLKALAKVSGNKKMELLHLADLEKTTGYIRGGCSPIGMKKQFPVYLSKDVQNLGTMIVSAGRRGFQVELAPQALKKLVAAEFAAIEA
ncbi:Cys-tRNA(Pro)/Cys-tRNA(Cys) deacylase [Carnobacterium iners]|uniref:Cys-tRNA(Pro)/Cys-tRNA(Cys) deacylase n=1 Tax=Carnobacterium iners TaxID=1073423 RepID=A0A1X7N6J9_9LACT|nr:Cys-tRNA(Pro) deacylase [Carnobacterium iners]SEK45707.1 Cys-tRNA(Pro)/Cys-tRNA(Cys) deacylase [Carnobacterium iners]SMH32995.1 Cys-tRNA(Pro)/Cys-tRNA(Cys) deacylase [Carnobacterium iners]